MSIIELSSATDKVLNGIPLGNIPMKMLVCLIDGYYDIGPLDYLNFFFFLLYIKVINPISFGTEV